MSGRDESRAGSTAPGTATPAPRTAPDAESSPAPASPAGPRARLRRTFRKAARAARRLRTSLLTRCVACVLAYAAVLVGLSHVASPKNNQSVFDMINLNCEEDAVEIDWNQDTSDAGDHLNLRGAQKVTTAVGALLAQRYGLTSHAGDRAYTAWDDAYARYAQQVTALQWTAGTATDATPVAQRQAPPSAAASARGHSPVWCGPHPIGCGPDSVWCASFSVWCGCHSRPKRKSWENIPANHTRRESDHTKQKIGHTKRKAGHTK